MCEFNIFIKSKKKNKKKKKLYKFSAKTRIKNKPLKNLFNLKIRDKK